MSEPRIISPLLDGFALGGSMSCHSGVNCYPAMRMDSDERYIVKTISIPASQTQLEALLLTGAYSSVESARAYFQELAQGIAAEVEILDKLAAQRGFVPFVGHQVADMEEGVGYEVYLISHYRRSLERQLKRQPLTHLAAVNMGIDLCAALAICREAGYLYVDLKPSNIYLSGSQEFHIGDLGFVALDSLKYASLPDRCRSSWTAPEVTDAFSTLNDTMDIYALGLTLYQVYNNGQLPFDSEESRQALMERMANGEAMPAPMYADYEMGQIIAKACAFDPAQRWANPSEMGHALIAYMQRNGANDIPIGPVVIPEPEEAPEAPVEEPSAEELPEEADVQELPDAPDEVPADESVADEAAAAPSEEELPAEEAEAETSSDDGEEAAEEPAGEESWIDRMDALLSEDGGEVDEENEDGLSLRQILESDETEPAEEDEPLTAEELSEDTADILSQADELIAHEAPEPAVAPEAIEIPMPEPIVLESDEAEEETAPSEAEEAAEEPGDEESLEEEAYDDYDEDAPKPKGKKLLAWLIALLIVALTGVGACYFYNNYYLQPIDAISASGEGDTMTVTITSAVDESKLTAVCVDLYGNKKTSPVSGGTATFTGLTPGTQYSVSLEIEGLHSLTGQTTAQYYTLPQANVLGFSSVTGPEDGSVILSFTTEGPEIKGWSIAYSTEGEAVKTLNFTGNLITISGLTVDSEYHFTLDTTDDVELVGTTEFTCVPSALVFAENLTVSGYQDGTITALWSAPEGTTVESWTARCYNDSGYDQILTVTEASATFTEIAADASYTIEIIAAGMTQSTRAYVTANPITITNVNTQVMNGSIAVAWEFEGEAPEGGWLLLYTMQGGSGQHVIQCDSPIATIDPAVPGCHYDITIQAANTTSVFGGTGSADVPAAGVFGNYGLSASDISVTLCKAPEADSWSYSDVPESSLTSDFTVGDSVGILLRTTRTYNIDYTTIVAMYVVKDTSGVPVCVSTTSATWEAMWSNGRCTLEVPQIPSVPGSYILEVYLSGDLLTSQALTIS